MLFNSFAFLIFFVPTFLVFYTTQGIYRHLTLFIASCIFYAWFIPKYLLVLFVLILLDYSAAHGISRSSHHPTRKKIILVAALLNTCAVLFIFKYHNFFTDNLNSLGFSFHHWDIILPIGLSFHTFQSLSYVLDVYWKKIPAERNLLIYANYVMMFPQLVAGPIERGAHLLPQLTLPFSYTPLEADFIIGLSRFFYGLFKKIVVADSIGLYVDAVYSHYELHSGATLALATLLFSLQIYADFSGYSDMAIGIARTLGLRFNENFQTPYFSTSITEFWRRWHISLSSWLKDYLYYPLVLNLGRISKYKIAFSTFITFTLIGLWHGANWTFIIFGMLHGFYLVVELLAKGIWKNRSSLTRNILLPFQSLAVYFFVSLSFIFFRSATVHQALYILSKIVQDFSFHTLSLLDTTTFGTILLTVFMLILSEWFVFRNYSFESIYALRKGSVYLSGIACICLLFILAFGQIGGTGFIYFQF